MMHHHNHQNSMNIIKFCTLISLRSFLVLLYSTIIVQGGCHTPTSSPSSSSSSSESNKNLSYVSSFDNISQRHCQSHNTNKYTMKRKSKVMNHQDDHQDEVESDDHFIRSLLWKEAKYRKGDYNNNGNSQTSSQHNKRTSYLPWQPYFLAIAKLTSQRSKDPRNQVGACIVDSDNKILGIGYNGFPRGCSDDLLPWKSSSSSSTTNDDDDADDKNDHNNNLHHKEWFMVHAEVNAILNKIGNVTGTTMYVYGSFPCNECAKIIIQAGIKEIVYIDNFNNDNDASKSYREVCHDDHDNNIRIKASRVLFGLAGVKVTRYNHYEQSTDKIPDIEFKSGHVNATNVDVADEVLQLDEDTKVQKEKNSTSYNNIILESHRNLLIKEANYDPLHKDHNDFKRQNYLSWDDYFMSVASLSAFRSKDPNTQVGACIVDSNKCIIGIGYNGFPRGCSDDHLPWARRESNPLHNKYLYVVHAEVNAILNKGSKDCTGATIYVDLFPCNDCAKVIIQSGIKEVVYLNDTYHETDMCRASRIMFEMAGVKCRQHVPKVQCVKVDLFNR